MDPATKQSQSRGEIEEVGASEQTQSRPAARETTIQTQSRQEVRAMEGPRQTNPNTAGDRGVGPLTKRSQSRPAIEGGSRGDQTKPIEDGRARGRGPDRTKPIEGGDRRVGAMTERSQSRPAIEGGRPRPNEANRCRVIERRGGRPKEANRSRAERGGAGEVRLGGGGRGLGPVAEGQEIRPTSSGSSRRSSIRSRSASSVDPNTILSSC